MTGRAASASQASARLDRRTRGLLLLGIQLVLVLSVAAQFAYDRATRPRLWVRTAPVDPDAPLRGRYLALGLQVDACAIPVETFPQPPQPARGQVKFLSGQLADEGGHLVAKPAPSGTETNLRLPPGATCDHALLQEPVDLYLPEHAPLPVPLHPGQHLWVEVTLPRKGPPRPIQLALSDASGFHPLGLR